MRERGGGRRDSLRRWRSAYLRWLAWAGPFSLFLLHLMHHLPRRQSWARDCLALGVVAVTSAPGPAPKLHLLHLLHLMPTLLRLRPRPAGPFNWIFVSNLSNLPNLPPIQSLNVGWSSFGDCSCPFCPRFLSNLSNLSNLPRVLSFLPRSLLGRTEDGP